MKNLTEGLSEQTRNILESIGDAISIQDRNFRVLYQNKAHKEIVGDHEGLFCFAAYEKRDNVCDGCPVNKCFEDGNSHTTERMTSVGGKNTYVEITSSPLRDSEGNIIACIELARNISDRKRMEREIIRAQEEWEETFNIINEAITIHDEDFNVLRYNDAAEEILNIQMITTQRKKCYELYHGTGCPPNGCPSCKSLETKKPTVTEFWEPHLEKYLEVKAIPRLNDKNVVIGMVHVVRDITERKKIEEAQQKLQAQLYQAQKMEGIGQLAGGIAHDFNNILSAILGYGSLLQMNLKEDDPRRSNANEIVSAAGRATVLVQNLLAFSRKRSIDPQPINANKIINNVKKILQRLISEDISFDINLAEDEMMIMADAGQLEQIFMNLATNARDAMPKGGTLSISTSKIEIDQRFIQQRGYGKIGTFVKFVVADTGHGIPEELMEKIFEPFFTTKEVGKGTGLGLAMVYGTIKQHGGYIEVESAHNKGTSFSILLPIIHGVKEETEILVTSLEFGKGYGTILLVEDDEALRTLSRIILENFGYTVITAVDGEDAIEKFLKQKDVIELVIMDVVMPRKNGREAYESMKKIKEDVKVIFMSGYPREVISEKGIISDSVEFAYKPITPQAIMEKIKKVLGK